MKYEIDHERYEGLTGRELKEALWALYERAYQEGKADAFDQPSELPYYGADVPSEWNDKAKAELMAHVRAHDICLPGETAADYVQRMRAKHWPEGNK